MKNLITTITLILSINTFSNLDKQAGFEALDEANFFTVAGSVKHVRGDVYTGQSKFTDAAYLSAVRTSFRTPNGKNPLYVMMWAEGAKSNQEAENFCNSIGWKLPTADNFFMMQMMQSINELDDYMFGTDTRAIWVNNQYVTDAVSTPNLSGSILSFSDLLQSLQGSEDFSKLNRFGLPPVCIFGDYEAFLN